MSEYPVQVRGRLSGPPAEPADHASSGSSRSSRSRSCWHDHGLLGHRRRTSTGRRHGRGRRHRAALPPAAADDPVPREVPALVVRLEPRAAALQQPGRRLRRADGRPLPVDRRRSSPCASTIPYPDAERDLEPLAAAGQVVPRDPALHRAVLPLHRRVLRGDRAPGSRSSSPAATRAGSSTSSRASSAGTTASSATPSSSSPTSTRRSACATDGGAPGDLRCLPVGGLRRTSSRGVGAMGLARRSHRDGRRRWWPGLAERSTGRECRTSEHRHRDRSEPDAARPRHGVEPRDRRS